VILIPKKDNTTTLNDYSPISLIGCIYKIIDKILANRLKGVLQNVIDNTQSVFLSGSGLSDNILIANETVDFLRKEKEKRVRVKVDYEKAYDSVQWDSLVYMMARLGFDHKWINFIKMCLNSATISVLVNGSLTKEFKPKRFETRGSTSPFFVPNSGGRVSRFGKGSAQFGCIRRSEVGAKGVTINFL